MGMVHNDPGTAGLVMAAIDQLESVGPTLGHPLVDGIPDSKAHNMKELRSGSAGSTEVRTLFVFGPQRQVEVVVRGEHPSCRAALPAVARRLGRAARRVAVEDLADRAGDLDRSEISTVRGYVGRSPVKSRSWRSLATNASPSADPTSNEFGAVLLRIIKLWEEPQPVNVRPHGPACARLACRVGCVAWRNRSVDLAAYGSRASA
jgi:Phage derived protein Gp49-like (DUF891)